MHESIQEQINILSSKIIGILSSDESKNSEITISILDNISGLNDLNPEIKLSTFESTLRAVTMLSRFKNNTGNGTQKLGYLLLHKAIYESLPYENRSALDQPILSALRSTWKNDLNSNKDAVKLAERVVSHAEIFHQYLFIAEVWLDTARSSWLKFYSLEDALMYIEKCLIALDSLQERSDDLLYSERTLLRASAYRLRGEILRHSGKFESAISDLHQAVHLFGGLNSTSNLIDCHCLIASAYFLNGEFGKSKEFLDIVLANPQLLQHTPGYAAALNLLGNNKALEGDMNSALDNHRKSLQLYVQIGDYAGQASVLQNLGTLFEESHEFEKAIEYYSKSLMASEKSGNRTEQSLVLNNIGKVHLDMKHYEEALSYFERSYQISKAVGNLPNQELALLNTSQLYSTIGEYDSALQTLETLRKIIGQTGHRMLEAAALINVGEIYFQTKNYRASQESFRNSLLLLDELGENPQWKQEAVDGLKKLQTVLNKKL